MLIYCTEGKGWYRILGKQYTVENTNISSSLPVSPTHSGQTREIHGLFTGYTSKGSFAINSCRRIRFRSLFRRMNIPVYKIGYGCLRRYIAVSPWDILKNIWFIPPCAFTIFWPLSSIWSNSAISWFPRKKNIRSRHGLFIICVRTSSRILPWRN